MSKAVLVIDMPEQEAIEIIKGINEVRGNLPEDGNDVEIALMMAKDALEEIQQYRALGTVEEIKKIISFLSLDGETGLIDDANLLNQYRMLGTVEELNYKISHYTMYEKLVEKYREIGTPEELREAREKQVPKKPYIQSEGHGENEYDCYECPNCDSFLGHVSDCKDEHYRYDYCPNCGQAIDWEVADD